MQHRLFRGHHPDQIQSEVNKIDLILSLFTRRTKQWATVLQSQNSEAVKSETHFNTLIKAVFDHPQAGKDVGSLLHEVRWGNYSTVDSALEFHTFEAESGWSA
ncbi:hypothetical protein AOLI_G00031300 [Acnodon oligacanthus]